MGMSKPGVLHPCAAPRCSALLPPGQTRCAAHTYKPIDDRRANSGARGYDRQWQIRRGLFLQRYPLCGMRPDGRAPVMSACAEHGRRTVATLVDHVDPHRGDRAKFWNERENWQSLCASCHAAKTRAGR